MRVPQSTVGDIFILFWNICNDIAFNRTTIPIKKVVVNEKPDKTIVDPAALLNLPGIIYQQSKHVSKSL